MFRARVAILSALVTLAMLTGGCPSDTGTPSEVDGGVIGDDDGGSTGSAGIEFRLKSKPSSFPGDAGGPFEVKIESVVFNLRDIRAIGDSASGDERTSLPSLSLEWPRSDDDEDEYRFDFPSAPSGTYWELLAQVMDYEIEGTVKIDDARVPFEIEDELPSSLSLSVDLADLPLPVGSSEEVEIEVQLDRLVRDIAWDSVPEDDGKRVIEEGDELQTLRAQLNDIFVVKD